MPPGRALAAHTVTAPSARKTRANNPQPCSRGGSSLNIGQRQIVKDISKEKEEAAAYCVKEVQDGMIVGLGTGTTASKAIAILGDRVGQGLKIRAIPTSRASQKLAGGFGIPLMTFADTTAIDLTIDGADEIGPGLSLIKGGGGALLHEKIVATASKRLLICADSTKTVKVLGAFPLPLEVVPFGWQAVASRLEKQNLAPKLRVTAENSPFLTDEGNYNLDCHCGSNTDPQALARQLDSMTGIVEHGLFLNLAHRAIVATEHGIQVLE
jgi:ribose 5-phosphate isomerase A